MSLRVLDSCSPAAAVAGSLGLEIDATPSPGERYVVVVDNAAGVGVVSTAATAGWEAAVAVAWRLPAALLSKLIRQGVPVIIGMPSSWDLSVALEKGASEDLAAEAAHWAALESYLSRPPAVFPPTPPALEAQTGGDR